jgi:hypothetical protein
MSDRSGLSRRALIASGLGALGTGVVCVEGAEQRAKAGPSLVIEVRKPTAKDLKPSDVLDKATPENGPRAVEAAALDDGTVVLKGNRLILDGDVWQFHGGYGYLPTSYYCADDALHRWQKELVITHKYVGNCEETGWPKYQIVVKS